MNCGTYYREMNVTYDEFADSLEKVYAFLKQNDKINNKYCRYELGDYYGKKGYAGKQMLIPMEECYDCKSIYFHNPDDSGIDEGQCYCDDWICSDCLDKKNELNIIAFDEERKELRDKKKNHLISSGTIIEEQDKCCICLDELIICEVTDPFGLEEKNKIFVCNHSMCGKCYFDYKNNSCSNTEKSCDVIFCPLCKTVIGHIIIPANIKQNVYDNIDFYECYNYEDENEDNDEELRDLKIKMRDYAIRMRKFIIKKNIRSKYKMVQRGFYHYNII